MIHALLENGRTPPSDETREESTAPLLSEQFIPENLPKYETATFITPKRQRSTVWTVDEIEDDDGEVATAY